MSDPIHKYKIKEVCENLYIQNIVVKTEDDVDVKPYFNPVEIEWVKVKMGTELAKIKEYIDKSLKVRLKALKNMGVIKTVSGNCYGISNRFKDIHNP